ncbi:hypothetical protein FA95DRAFT_526553 [Auriscalpium vulgare]|uniref:Uncharacterized protein n=1 Tax=Auriscalpium vulgare TaxID=40419 RepID=A0ACB8S426_9AGAM|nr:hypothetical protein FA95DRAFT_526553 [Auriscalpium vulgare]
MGVRDIFVFRVGIGHCSVSISSVPPMTYWFRRNCDEGAGARFRPRRLRTVVDTKNPSVRKSPFLCTIGPSIGNRCRSRQPTDMAEGCVASAAFVSSHASALISKVDSGLFPLLLRLSSTRCRGTFHVDGPRRHSLASVLSFTKSLDQIARVKAARPSS